MPPDLATGEASEARRGRNHHYHRPKYVKIEIIAELAQGYEGNPDQSRLLLRAAAAAGADAAKFQIVFAEELCTPEYKHFALFRQLEMPDEAWMELARQAKSQAIALYADIFGFRSLELAARLGCPAVKIHGTDLSNTGLLQKVAQSGVPKVLLGAGGADRPEIEHALQILQGKDVVVLLGFQGYPTPNETNQIDRVRLLARQFDGRATVGFADHAPPDSPLSVALACVALGAGASVLEKHLTLGRHMKLEDHESALNPDEFATFCEVVRESARALGAAEDAEDFGMSEAERQYKQTIRKHVVAARDLAAGTVIDSRDVALKRTPSMSVLVDPREAYGRRLRRQVSADTPLTADLLE